MRIKATLLPALMLVAFLFAGWGLSEVHAAEDEPTAPVSEQTTDIGSVQCSLSGTSFVYSGKAITPEVTVSDGDAELIEGQSYTIKYDNNTDVGTATVTLTGIGSYTGSTTLKFTVTRAPLTECTATLSKDSYAYNGKERTPSVTVKYGTKKLKKNRDFTVTYSKNINAGTAKVKIKGIGNFSKSVKKTFTITKRTFKKSYVSLGRSEYIYSGKKLVPSVTVRYNDTKLVLKTDYTVKYSNNKKPGIATVLVTAKKNFTGTVTKTFKILPEQPNLYNVNSSGKKLTLTWEKDKNVSGYEICRKTSKGKWKVIKTIKKKAASYTDQSSVSYGSSYKYRIRSFAATASKKVYSLYSKTVSTKAVDGAPTIVSVTPASSSSFVINWDQVSDADGYILYRRENNKSKWKKIKTYNSGVKITYTDSSLKYGKTYTYNLRSYRKNGSKKQLSAMDSNGFTAKLSYKAKYKGGFKLYYDAAGNLIRNVEGIIGKQSSYHIKVNKQANVVTVYAKDGDNGYIIPVKAFLCSCGGSETPVGTFYTPQKYRWHTLNHNVEGQWCTRIHDGVLFHSVWYYSRSKTDLTTVQYNRLGTTASMGCVRLNCESAKWIYDNCSLGTSVTIYTSSDPGPLGKPKALILPSWHTWDPTDPTCADLCKQHGCH